MAPQYWLQHHRPEQAKKFKFHHGKGCNYCSHTGYKGRIPIHELLEVNNNMKSLITLNKTADEIEKAAKLDGMSTLRNSAIQLVLNGITTIEEIIAVTRSIK